MANPRTCLHRIIGSELGKNQDSFIFCMICDSDLTHSKPMKDNLYEYDIDNDVWILVSEDSVRRKEG